MKTAVDCLKTLAQYTLYSDEPASAPTMSPFEGKADAPAHLSERLLVAELENTLGQQ